MKTSHICVIDYGLGNLTSVSNALTRLGVQHEISSSPANLIKASHIILPGVGSFRAGMHGLERGGWIPGLRQAVLEEKIPFLGICLGMQLIADEGFEGGRCAGLSFLPGRVEKIPVENEPLPHIGWNNVTLKSARITKGLSKDPDFYFLHSYRFVPNDRTVIVGTTHYETSIVAIVESGNVFGTQFHPEKSQDNGMQILKNFMSV